MRLSQQVQDALCALFDLAYHGEAEAPVQVRVVAERQGLAPRMLEQIFGRLRRAELVVAKRGPGGGYRLARAPSEITVRAIVEALEGPLEDRIAGGGAHCGDRRWPRPDFLWSWLGAELGHALDGMTLEAICRRAAAEGVRRVDAERRTYHI